MIYMLEGELVIIKVKLVVLVIGGVGCVYYCNINGGIVTGDGMVMVFCYGVFLCDMEFV